MPAFAGLRGTGDWGVDERPKNFREAILWREPNGMAPLTAMLARMGSESTDDPEFAWWEEQLDQIKVITNADLAAASTTASTASGALYLVPGDILLVQKTETSTYDNELVYVSSVTSDTAFVIQRGRAGTTPAGALSGSTMVKIGNAFEEGTLSPQVSTRNPTKFRNYTQIFKTAVEQTRTATETKARTGDAWKNDKKRKMFDHSIALEYAALWGVASETAVGPTKGKPMRTTAGLRSFMATNVKIYTTTPTESDFLDFTYKLFNYSGSGINDERIVLCGNGWLNSLNKMAKSSPSTRIIFDGGVVRGNYGMRLLSYTIPQGTFGVKTHPLMNTDPKWTNSAFIFHGNNIKERTLHATEFQDNIQAPDADERKAQWLTEVGYEYHHEATMGYIGNFIVP